MSSPGGRSPLTQKSSKVVSSKDITVLKEDKKLNLNNSSTSNELKGLPLASGPSNNTNSPKQIKKSKLTENIDEINRNESNDNYQRNVKNVEKKINSDIQPSIASNNKNNPVRSTAHINVKQISSDNLSEDFQTNMDYRNDSLNVASKEQRKSEGKNISKSNSQNNLNADTKSTTDKNIVKSKSQGSNLHKVVEKDFGKSDSQPSKPLKDNEKILVTSNSQISSLNKDIKKIIKSESQPNLKNANIEKSMKITHSQQKSKEAISNSEMDIIAAKKAESCSDGGEKKRIRSDPPLAFNETKSGMEYKKPNEKVVTEKLNSQKKLSDSTKGTQSKQKDLMKSASLDKLDQKTSVPLKSKLRSELEKVSTNDDIKNELKQLKSELLKEKSQPLLTTNQKLENEKLILKKNDQNPKIIDINSSKSLLKAKNSDDSFLNKSIQNKNQLLQPEELKIESQRQRLMDQNSASSSYSSGGHMRSSSETREKDRKESTVRFTKDAKNTSLLPSQSSLNFDNSDLAEISTGKSIRKKIKNNSSVRSRFDENGVYLPSYQLQNLARVNRLTARGRPEIFVPQGTLSRSQGASLRLKNLQKDAEKRLRIENYKKKLAETASDLNLKKKSKEYGEEEILPERTIRYNQSLRGTLKRASVAASYFTRNERASTIGPAGNLALGLNSFRQATVEIDETPSKFWIFVDDIISMDAERYINYFPEDNDLPVPITLSFTIIMVILFILMIIMGDPEGKRGFAPYIVNPMIGPTFYTQIMFGGSIAVWIRNDFKANWWRLFNASFLHAGIIHILINGSALLIMGPKIDRWFGIGRVFVLFILCSVGAQIFDALLRTELVVAVGASGTICGLVGVIIADNIKNWDAINLPKMQLGYWMTQIIVFFAFGFLPLVDNIVHVGGFITGIFTGLLIVPRLKAVEDNMDLETCCISSEASLVDTDSLKNPGQRINQKLYQNLDIRNIILTTIGLIGTLFIFIFLTYLLWIDYEVGVPVLCNIFLSRTC